MNVPKLRFKEFTGEWERYRLADFTIPVKRKNKGNVSNLPLTISSLDGLVDQRYYFNRVVASKDMSNYYLLYNGEFAYNKSYSAGFPLGSIKRLDKYEKGALSSLYICFAIDEQYIDSDYATYYFDSDKWHKEVSLCVAEGARNHGLLNVSNVEFYETKHLVPNKQEQNRISYFLQFVYDKIKNQKAIVESLEKQKKGLMQKIFSQELRFKDDDGKEFPDWEEKKLGEVCDTFSGGTPSVSNKRFYNGDVPFIKSGEIHNDSTEGFISAEGLKNSSAKIVEEGDLLYALYGANSGDVAISKIKGAINQAILCIRTNELNKEYLCELLGFSRKNLMNTYLQGGQGNFSAEIFKNLKFLFPKKKEQKKIADFLIVYNEKIDNERKVLVRWQQIKKGLLQQMFV